MFRSSEKNESVALRDIVREELLMRTVIGETAAGRPSIISTLD